eukprot:1157015-Pelagomonas_calceolata.AAC.3
MISSVSGRVTGEHMRGKARSMTAPVARAVTGITGGHVIIALRFTSVFFFAHWAPTKLTAWVLCQPPGFAFFLGGSLGGSLGLP